MIKKEPGICGGSACIGDRRLPVWVVIQRLRWTTPQGVAHDYPSLSYADIDDCRAYAKANEAEIEKDIMDNTLED